MYRSKICTITTTTRSDDLQSQNTDGIYHCRGAFLDNGKQPCHPHHPGIDKIVRNDHKLQSVWYDINLQRLWQATVREPTDEKRSSPPCSLIAPVAGTAFPPYVQNDSKLHVSGEQASCQSNYWTNPRSGFILCAYGSTAPRSGPDDIKIPGVDAVEGQQVPTPHKVEIYDLDIIETLEEEPSLVAQPAPSQTTIPDPIYT